MVPSFLTPNHTLRYGLIYILISALTLTLVAVAFPIDSLLHTKAPDPASLIKISLRASAASISSQARSPQEHQTKPHKAIKAKAPLPKAKTHSKKPDDPKDSKKPTGQPKPQKGPDSAEVLQEATYRYQTPPQYPQRAKDLGQEGLVLLKVKLSTKGLPIETQVASSSGHRLLDAAALAAVQQWRFEPILQDNQPHESWVRVPIRFQIIPS